MLKVRSLCVGYLSVNCYILYNDESDNAVLIDPGGSFARIKAALGEIKKNPCAILLTHGHFDHIMACPEFQKEGVPVYIYEVEAPKLSNEFNLASSLKIRYTPFSADKTLSDGEILDFFGIRIRVLLTKGHTDGSVCFICENKIFSGDTLFEDSFGRTDFPTGSVLDMKNSLKMLFDLQGEYTVYPGHGEPTSLDKERRHNPILFI